MSFWSEFLSGYRAVRNGPGGAHDNAASGPWADPRHAPRPEWGLDAPWTPPERGEGGGCTECEQLRSHIAARQGELAECRSVIAELWEKNEASTQRLDSLNSELARVQETRDRYQANGKRAVGELDTARERSRQIEAILKFPGVKKALLKAVHSDMHPGASARERRALDEMCRTVILVFEGLEGHG